MIFVNLMHSLFSHCTVHPKIYDWSFNYFSSTTHFSFSFSFLNTKSFQFSFSYSFANHFSFSFSFSKTDENHFSFISVSVYWNITGPGLCFVGPGFSLVGPDLGLMGSGLSLMGPNLVNITASWKQCCFSGWPFHKLRCMNRSARTTHLTKSIH